MECKVNVFFLYLLFVTAHAIEVNLTKAWIEDIGWQTNCSWRIPSDDFLQSVRLYQNNQQFFIYRPEIDGDSRVILYKRLEDLMTTSCFTSKDDRLRGTCLMNFELLQPQRDSFTIVCEVSGERPMFRIEKRSILVDNFVPPTAAAVKVGSVNEKTGWVTLNCTASGVPIPYLSWTIGDQQVPHDFKGGFWNVTSKLWQAWSVFSYTPSSVAPAVCTPEISRGGKLVKGHAVLYNSARKISGDVLTGAFITVVFLILLR